MKIISVNLVVKIENTMKSKIKQLGKFHLKIDQARYYKIIFRIITTSNILNHQLHLIKIMPVRQL